jgi:hypothetical protein
MDSTGMSSSSATRARIEYIRNILEECIKNDEYLTAEVCVRNHAIRVGIPSESAPKLYVDYFGEQLILVPSDKCEGISLTIPYSKGPNRIDECGQGDDIL